MAQQKKSVGVVLRVRLVKTQKTQVFYLNTVIQRQSDLPREPRGSFLCVLYIISGVSFLISHSVFAFCVWNERVERDNKF